MVTHFDHRPIPHKPRSDRRARQSFLQQNTLPALPIQQYNIPVPKYLNAGSPPAIQHQSLALVARDPLRPSQRRGVAIDRGHWWSDGMGDRLCEKECATWAVTHAAISVVQSKM